MLTKKHKVSLYVYTVVRKSKWKKCFLVFFMYWTSIVVTIGSQVDNIILLTDNYIVPEDKRSVTSYVTEVNNKALVVQLFLSER